MFRCETQRNAGMSATTPLPTSTPDPIVFTASPEVKLSEKLKAEKTLVQKSGYFARSAKANQMDLDLIITCDTSIAHLAGGMGKPTWLLLHHLPEWRWGIEGDSTFWYPSMKLFRHKEQHNWYEVMKRVSITLRSL